MSQDKLFDNRQPGTMGRFKALQTARKAVEDFRQPTTRNHGPVVRLGMTVPNDEERRKHALEKLRDRLKDPELRMIEGFPIGSDEDILSLSDPPTYTACPNSFLDDFNASAFWAAHVAGSSDVTNGIKASLVSPPSTDGMVE